VSVEPLRERVRGQVLTGEVAGYDEARAVNNGMFDKRPLAVLRAEQVADVIAGVDFSRDNGLELSILNGGHSGPGFGTNDGGLVIDMSPSTGATSVNAGPASDAGSAFTYRLRRGRPDLITTDRNSHAGSPTPTPESTRKPPPDGPVAARTPATATGARRQGQQVSHRPEGAWTPPWQAARA